MKNFLHNIAQKGKSALAWLGQLAYNIYKAIAKFIFKLLYEEYELTVWYLKDSVRDKDGNAVAVESMNGKKEESEVDVSLNLQAESQRGK